MIALLSKRLIAALLCVAAMSSFASAQSLLDRCEAALAVGDTQAAILEARRLTNFTTIPSGPDRARAERCLSEAFEEPWAYDPGLGGFFSIADAALQTKAAEDARQAARLQREEARRRRDEERAALEERRLAAAEAEAEQAARASARRRAVVSATVAACRDLYGRDRMDALTNSLCHEIFLVIGLPE